MTNRTWLRLRDGRGNRASATKTTRPSVWDLASQAAA